MQTYASFGTLFAPALGGILVSTTGYVWPFVIDGISFVILGAALLLLGINLITPSYNLRYLAQSLVPFVLFGIVVLILVFRPRGLGGLLEDVRE